MIVDSVTTTLDGDTHYLEDYTTKELEDELKTREDSTLNRVLQAFSDYVAYDAESAEIDYVKDVLDGIGITEDEYDEFGLSFLA